MLEWLDGRLGSWAVGWLGHWMVGALDHWLIDPRPIDPPSRLMPAIQLMIYTVVGRGHTSPLAGLGCSIGRAVGRPGCERKALPVTARPGNAFLLQPTK